MKKIIRTIKLHKLKTKITENSLELCKGSEFIVIFEDNTCKRIYYRKDLIDILEKDHIKKVWYIFDMTDRIIVDRDIVIDESEVF